MTIILLILSFWASIFGATIVNFNNVQSTAQDTERKSDINAIHAQLESHYAQFAEYPTEKELSLEYDTQIPGADIETLTDPDGDFIQQGDYLYRPSICTAVGCQHYELSSHLEDGSKYTKKSLN